MEIKEYRGIKLYDTIYVLDYYDIKETYIKGFKKDMYYENDEAEPIETMFVLHEYGVDRFYDVFRDISSAEHEIARKKRCYDGYVTRPRRFY